LHVHDSKSAPVSGRLAVPFRLKEIGQRTGETLDSATEGREPVRVAGGDEHHTALGIPEQTSPAEVVEDHVIVKDWPRRIDQRQDVGYPDLLYGLPHQIGRLAQLGSR
jgi:hypothetical protein